MYIKLYQINLDRDVNRVAFEGMDYLNRFAGGNLDSSIYDLVYEGQVPDGVDPEGLYRATNTDSLIHMSIGRTMSVSDVLYTRDGKTGQHWFCDSISFRPVDFDPNKTKRAVPTAMGTTPEESGCADASTANPIMPNSESQIKRG